MRRGSLLFVVCACSVTSPSSDASTTDGSGPSTGEASDGPISGGTTDDVDDGSDAGDADTGATSRGTDDGSDSGEDSTGGDGGTLHCGDAMHGRVPASPTIEWTNVLSVPAGNGLLVDPAIPGDFYVFYETGELNSSPQRVQKSTDFGVTWNLIDETNINGNAWGVAIDPNPDRCAGQDPCPPPTLYRPAGYGFGNPDGSALGMWKSIDGGVTWINLFAGYDDGVLPAPDGGTSIVPADSNGGHVDFYQAHILPDDPPNHVLITYHYGSGQLLETTDGGETWVVHSVPWGTSHYAFGFDASTWIVIPQQFDAPGAMYRTTTAGRIDGVVTPDAWVQVDGSLHCHGGFTPYVDPTDCSLYIAGSEGVKRTQDQGATWETLHEEQGCTISGSPDLLFISNLFKTDALRLDLREMPVGATPFNFAEGWDGIPPFGTATSYDAANDEWVILATQYAGGVWRLVLPQ